MAVTRENVLKARERVIDPASGRNVVEAGLIQGLVVRDGNVGFSVEVPAARGRESEPLRKACEDAVAKVPGVLSVTAVLTAHQTSSPKPQPQREAPPPPGRTPRNRS